MDKKGKGRAYEFCSGTKEGKGRAALPSDSIDEPCSSSQVYEASSRSDGQTCRRSGRAGQDGGLQLLIVLTAKGSDQRKRRTAALSLLLFLPPFIQHCLQHPTSSMRLLTPALWTLLAVTVTASRSPAPLSDPSPRSTAPSLFDRVLPAAFAGHAIRQLATRDERGPAGWSCSVLPESSIISEFHTSFADLKELTLDSWLRQKTKSGDVPTLRQTKLCRASSPVYVCFSLMLWSKTEGD